MASSGEAQKMTPGPWVAVVLGSEGYAIMGPPQDGRLGRRRVARCGDTDWEQDKANAKVIAATPDLLALVRDLVDADDCWYDHHGYCQGHSLHEKPCPHERAKALLVHLQSGREQTDGDDGVTP